MIIHTVTPFSLKVLGLQSTKEKKSSKVLLDNKGSECLDGVRVVESSDNSSSGGKADLDLSDRDTRIEHHLRLSHDDQVIIL